jgi:hypothetical protein
MIFEMFFEIAIEMVACFKSKARQKKKKKTLKKCMSRIKIFEITPESAQKTTETRQNH